MVKIKQQDVALFLIAQKHKVYGYTSLETLAEWNRKTPKKSTPSFSCKKVTELINIDLE